MQVQLSKLKALKEAAEESQIESAAEAAKARVAQAAAAELPSAPPVADGPAATTFINPTATVGQAMQQHSALEWAMQALANAQKQEAAALEHAEQEAATKARALWSKALLFPNPLVVQHTDSATRAADHCEQPAATHTGPTNAPENQKQEEDAMFADIVLLFQADSFQLPVRQFIDAKLAHFGSKEAASLAEKTERQQVFEGYDSLITSQTTERVLSEMRPEWVENALLRLTTGGEHPALTTQLLAADDFKTFEQMMVEAHCKAHCNQKLQQNVTSDVPKAPSMAETRKKCKEIWGKSWYDVAEDVQGARKRVAAAALGGPAADEASTALAGVMAQSTGTLLSDPVDLSKQPLPTPDDGSKQDDDEFDEAFECSSDEIEDEDISIGGTPELSSAESRLREKLR